MAGDVRADWVRRVLGVQVGADAGAQAGLDGAGLDGAGFDGAGFDGAGFKREFAKAMTAWRDAAEAVEGQLNDLRQALLATDDAALHRIADRGLNGITGRRKVGLQAALVEVSGASGPAIPALARKAAAAAKEYRAFLLVDPRVKACDLYPEIETPIGPTLAGALAILADALAA